MAEEVRTFFRHCPSCGRRFEIRLVSKRIVDSEQIESDMEHYAPASAPLVLESDVPIDVEVDDFSYTYRCKHCGHQWSEERFETEHVDENISD